MNIRSFGSSALAITFAASILATATAACTVKTTGTGPTPSEKDGGKSPEDEDDDPKSDTKKDGGKPSTSTGSSSCLEIFSCAAECTGEGCEESCFEKGSSAGKAQVEAVLACASENECEDDECLAANCAEEVEACK